MIASVDWQVRSCVWTEWWLWSWFLASSVWPDIEVIQPSIWSNQALLSPFCVVWSFKFKWAWGFALIHMKPHKHCFYVALLATLTLPSSRLIPRLRNQCNLPLSSMWNVASSAFLTSETIVMLLDATMMSSTQTKMTIWPLSLLSRTSDDLSCFWWTPQ